MKNWLILALLCCPAIGQAMPVLDVSPAQFRFAIAPGGSPPPQTFRIINRGDGTLNPIATVAASSPWLQVSLSGATGTISISSNTLAAGIYSGTFTLIDPLAADSPRTIAVTLNVTSIVVTEPASLQVYLPVGAGGFRDVYLPLQSVPTGNIPAYVPKTQSGGNWLTLALDAESGVYIRSTFSSSLAAGSYAGNIEFDLGGKVVGTVPIALTVTSQPILAVNQQSLSVQTSPGREAPGQVIQVSGPAAWSATSDSPWMSAAQSGTSLLVSFSSAALAPGVYQGNVTIRSAAAANSSLTVPVTFQMIAAGAPAVQFGGVVDAANYCIRANCYLAPGSLVSMFGSQLANQTVAAAATPLPTTLATTQVLVNGTPAELVYVSYGQINFRLPSAPPNAARWIISVQRDGQSSNMVSAKYTSTAPSIFTVDQSGQGYGAILLAGQGIVANNTNPATRGNYVEVYGTGLGAGPTLPTVLFYGVGIVGNVEVTASYAGPAPGFVGLNQINVQIPASVPATDHLKVQLRTPFNLLSNSVEMAVR